MSRKISFNKNFAAICTLMVMSLLCAVPPARAEWTQVGEPEAAPAQPQPVPQGGARAQRLRAQQAEPEAPKPLPSGAPDTERRGDDLIVHSSGGEYSVPGFFSGMEDGMMKPLPLQLPGQGNCTAQIDNSGAIIDMACR